MNKNAAMVSIIGHPKKRLKSAAAGSKRGGIGCNERIGVGFALTEMQPVTTCTSTNSAGRVGAFEMPAPQRGADDASFNLP